MTCSRTRAPVSAEFHAASAVASSAFAPPVMAPATTPAAAIAGTAIRSIGRIIDGESPRVTTPCPIGLEVDEAVCATRNGGPAEPKPGPIFSRLWRAGEATHNGGGSGGGEQTARKSATASSNAVRPGRGFMAEGAGRSSRRWSGSAEFIHAGRTLKNARLGRAGGATARPRETGEPCGARAFVNDNRPASIPVGTDEAAMEDAWDAPNDFIGGNALSQTFKP